MPQESPKRPEERPGRPPKAPSGPRCGPKKVNKQPKTTPTRLQNLPWPPRSLRRHTNRSSQEQGLLVIWMGSPRGRPPGSANLCGRGTALNIDNITQCSRSRIMQCLRTANGESDEGMLQDQADCGNASPGQGSGPGSNGSLMKEGAQRVSQMGACQLYQKLMIKQRIP